jgi:hypothetical protein
MVLDFTSIGCSRILVNSEAYEKVGQESVAVIHFNRDLASDVGKRDEAVFVYVDISAVL